MIITIRDVNKMSYEERLKMLYANYAKLSRERDLYLEGIEQCIIMQNTIVKDIKEIVDLMMNETKEKVESLAE